MSFPQPSSNDYATQGSEFFRLLTPLASPGDIYQSNQSGLAMAIGPQSDLANVAVGYYDDQVPTFLQSVILTPNRPFVGRVAARNDALYSPAQRPGVVLFWADDLYDPNYVPSTFVAGDRMEFVAPVLDVIQYFSPVSSLSAARADKEFNFSPQPTALGTTTFIVIPYYGRKYCFIQASVPVGGGQMTFGITALNYGICPDPPNVGVPTHQELVVRAPANIAAGTMSSTRITSSSIGVFDAIVLSFKNQGGLSPCRVTMSDTI